MWKATTVAALAALMALGAAIPARSKAQPQAAAQEICGIAWETSLEAAKARAEREGKPIFLLHLMGRLDEEFC